LAPRPEPRETGTPSSRGQPALDRVYPSPIPIRGVRPPTGDDWLHEPKWDGFRFQIIKDGSQVRFHSRHGAECGDRLPGMADVFCKLPTQSAILDGEANRVSRCTAGGSPT
jgi:ATP-dependent DNA ligase